MSEEILVGVIPCGIFGGCWCIVATVWLLAAEPVKGYKQCAQFLWRVYCWYFIKSRIPGKVLFLVPFIIGTSLYILAFLIPAFLAIILVTATIIATFLRPRLWNDEVQCKNYHCTRKDKQSNE